MRGPRGGDAARRSGGRRALPAQGQHADVIAMRSRGPHGRAREGLQARGQRPRGTQGAENPLLREDRQAVGAQQQYISGLQHDPAARLRPHRTLAAEHAGHPVAQRVGAPRRGVDQPLAVEVLGNVVVARLQDLTCGAQQIQAAVADVYPGGAPVLHHDRHTGGERDDRRGLGEAACHDPRMGLLEDRAQKRRRIGERPGHRAEGLHHGVHRDLGGQFPARVPPQPIGEHQEHAGVGLRATDAVLVPVPIPAQARLCDLIAHGAALVHAPAPLCAGPTRISLRPSESLPLAVRRRAAPGHARRIPLS